MNRKSILGVAAVLVGVVAGGMMLLRDNPAVQRALAEEETQGTKRECDEGTITVDVVIEDVDVSAHTITARATTYVIPPHDNVGGAVFTLGTTDSPHNEKATQFVRLPVMPAADIKTAKQGLHAVLHLEVRSPGYLVVTGIDEFQGLERIGVDSLDAPGTEDGQ